MVTFCNKCGSSLAADVRFCPHCGTPAFSSYADSGASPYEPTALAARSQAPAQIPPTEYGSTPYGGPLQNPYESLNPYQTPPPPPPPLPPHRHVKFGLLIGLVVLVLVLVSGGVFVFLIRANSLDQAQHWYDRNYVYKEKITIDHTKVSGGANLSNFPVLISMTDPNLKTAGNGGYVQNSSGYDIVFVDSTETTKLDHEIEKYMATTGEIEMWVRIPTLSVSADTVIYMYYDNRMISSSQEQKRGVWDSNYQGVWHFPNGTTLSLDDSTSNGNNGTNNNGVAAIKGEVDGGANFNGTNQYISTGYTQTSITAYTVEAWINISNSQSAVASIVQDRGSTGTGHSLTFGVDGTGACGTSYCIGPHYVLWGVDSNNIFIGITNNTTVNDNSWHYVVGTWAASSGSAIAPSQFTLYVDGAAVSNPQTKTISSDTSPLTGSGGTVIGYHQAWNAYFLGSMDEVRISNTARPSGWISTEYNNQVSPSTFYTVGSATTLSSGATGIILLDTAHFAGAT